MTHGEFWWADFGAPFGSEAGFKRPVLIVQDDVFNRSRIGTVIVVPLTTNLRLADAPGNVEVYGSDTPLGKDSVLVVSQLTAIDRRRLTERISLLPRETLSEVEYGMRLVLDIN